MSDFCIFVSPSGLRQRASIYEYAPLGSAHDLIYSAEVEITQGQGWRMVASDGFADFLRDQLGSLGRITLRRMFGKTGVFCDELMLGMVADDTLYFRVDDLNRADFKEAQAFPPLNYEKQGSAIDLSFWRAPDRLFDEPDELVAWARLALAAARRVAAKRARPAPRRTSKPPPR